jgi:phosphoserine phosphatase
VSASQIEAKQLSAQEFESRVLDCNPRVAVFDCDGTLWSGDAGSGFMVWSIEQGLVSRSTSDWIDTRYRAYLAGSVSEAQICGEIVQMYAGLHEPELRTAAAKYFNEFVRSRVFTEMEALVSKLRRKGVELWAVSSTNKWVIFEGIRDFGIPEERILAASVVVKNDIITGELIAVPTDEAKATALRGAGLEQPDVVFGNSVHDLAMLEIARCAFPVNPTPALLEASAKRGWACFRPRETEGAAIAVGGE